MNQIDFVMQASVLGVKKFKGNIEGTEIDQTKVLVATPLDESQGNALGLVTSKYRYGTSLNFEKFKDKTFPFFAELSVSMTSNGKTQRINLVDFREIPEEPKKTATAK